MGKYTLEISSKARKELQVHYKSGNKTVIRRIEQIFLELSNTPYEGIGNPEALKYHLAGYWSRRINKKDRIIYKVYEDKVLVLVVSAIGHNGDKWAGSLMNLHSKPLLIQTPLAPHRSSWKAYPERGSCTGASHPDRPGRNNQPFRAAPSLLHLWGLLHLQQYNSYEL